MKKSKESAQEINLPPKLSEWRVEALVNTAKGLAEELSQGLDTQLRRIFDSVRRVELDFQREERFSRDDVLLLKPRLAYAVARQEKLRPIFTWLDKAIDRVQDGSDFQRLVQFIEAVLAYYKYERG